MHPITILHALLRFTESSNRVARSTTIDGYYLPPCAFPFIREGTDRPISTVDPLPSYLISRHFNPDVDRYCLVNDAERNDASLEASSWFDHSEPPNVVRRRSNERTKGVSTRGEDHRTPVDRGRLSTARCPR